MSLIEYAIELRPHFVFLCALDMAKGAHLFGLYRGRRSLRFVMIEIEIPPASGDRIALGILDGHISTVESAGEIPSPRRLRAGAVFTLGRAQHELQLLEHDCALRKFMRFLVHFVRPRLH